MPCQIFSENKIRDKQTLAMAGKVFRFKNLAGMIS